LLLNDLYTIHSLTEKENTIQASVLLQADHAIFKGHFPGQPVLPGVCMLEMITEIAGQNLNKQFRIKAASLIKFLRMIDPQKNTRINFEINWQVVSEDTVVSGKIFGVEGIFMKFQMVLTPEIEL
jgi:3-hydroxyacyl-[acyl-carrier-protein] dehydratase